MALLTQSTLDKFWPPWIDIKSKSICDKNIKIIRLILSSWLAGNIQATKRTLDNWDGETASQELTRILVWDHFFWTELRGKARLEFLKCFYRCPGRYFRTNHTHAMGTSDGAKLFKTVAKYNISIKVAEWILEMHYKQVHSMIANNFYIPDKYACPWDNETHLIARSLEHNNLAQWFLSKEYERRDKNDLIWGFLK